MADGGGQPFFRVRARLHNAREIGYIFYAEITAFLQLRKPHELRPFTFRLDTGTDVSLIPGHWFGKTRTRIGPLTRPFTINTPAGSGTARGRLARNIPVCFDPGGSHPYDMDFLVTDQLQTQYGLLALREVHLYFEIITRGGIVLDDTLGPLQLGRLELRPRRD
jgi:hypothetical protein